jgi:hypothetical protein
LAVLLAACSKQDEPKSAPPPPAPTPPQLTLTSSPTIQVLASTNVAGTNSILIERGIEVRGAGNLFIKFPRTWDDRISRVREKTFVFDTILFHPRTNGDFDLMVEVNNVGQAAVKRVEIKDVLQTAGLGELTNAVEKSLEIQKFQGPQVTACYFVVTDKNYDPQHPKKGDYHYLTQGYAKLGGLILSFRLVSNELSPEQGQMFEMIKTARLEKTAAAQKGPTSPQTP